MATKHLHAVSANEKPPRRPKTVAEAASTGTTRELLAAMRTRIAKAVEDPNTPARDLAALSKRLIEVARDIEAIDARDEQGSTASERPTAAAFDASAI